MNNQKTLLKKDTEPLEKQIKENFKYTDHSIREYPISVIVDKFTEGLDEDLAELYIPDYQREFVWTEKQQSKFIESLLLNLPIPYIFVSDTNEYDDGRLEIVDGSQRIRTLVRFLKDELTLSDLEKLTEANGFKFSDLSKPRQLRFGRISLRMIELTEKADEEARREIFDRLNSGGTRLNSMETIIGTSDSPLINFLIKISPRYENRKKTSEDTELAQLLRKLCPISETQEKRKEYIELLLRYFAYCDSYLQFEHRVDKFLKKYVDRYKEVNAENDGVIWTKDIEIELEEQLKTMLNFVKEYFPCGFKKAEHYKSTPRIRFEAIATGVTLALRQNPDLTGNTENIHKWLESKEFKAHTRSDASNSRPKVKERIEFVQHRISGK